MAKHKNSLKEYYILNAWHHGYGDYPRQNCFYTFAKNPEEHTAYWDGWYEAATETDRELNLHGLPYHP
jgi:hypothetical protein